MIPDRNIRALRASLGVELWEEKKIFEEKEIDLLWLGVFHEKKRRGVEGWEVLAEPKSLSNCGEKRTGSDLLKKTLRYLCYP